ncbi:hypothetical protein BJD57_gp26 [Gordonia phage Vivi2]|uniref:Uncharacterized protein n=2 Tax=Vividuovirus TaxID=2560251 RepID=A0A142K9S5_9CAUD|nr:hypothetical protein BJD57_gp26 [Gordonia phage Vivi2]YP_010099603.1 hypothetical protein KNU23_gp24 [Gordonia phage Tangent]AMS02858.1 hypothetical protein SEA_VIVI2_26 [Gordonia phage Vivi2]AYR03574.1 hypothetical protein SEA_TANGENT_24 [Gordonia phage Tangent]
MTISVLGDSQTDYAGYGVRPCDTWSARLGRNLRSAGMVGPVRGFGIQGDQTLAGLNRVDAMHMYDIADVALLPLGVNDWVASPSILTSAQTTQYIQATVMALRHGATGPGVGTGFGAPHVATVDALPGSGRPGQRYVVLADASTTGGVAKTEAGQTATIAGSVAADVNGNRVTVWEFRQNQAGERGWGRVAVRTTPATHTKRFAVIAPPYRNFTTGGDTPSTPVAGNATLRTAQQAAVTAQNQAVDGAPTVIYIDAYTAMRQRIVSGADPDFSAVAYDQSRSWTYIQNNQHLSTYGHDVFEQVVRAALVAQAPTWLTDLGATL